MASVSAQCNHCGKSIQVLLSKLAKGRGRYCSRACGNAARLESGGTGASSAPDVGASAPVRAVQPPLCQTEDSARYGQRVVKPFYDRGSSHYWSKKVRKRRPKHIRASGIYYARQS